MPNLSHPRSSPHYNVQPSIRSCSAAWRNHWCHWLGLCTHWCLRFMAMLISLFRDSTVDSMWRRDNSQTNWGPNWEIRNRALGTWKQERPGWYWDPLLWAWLTNKREHQLVVSFSEKRSKKVWWKSYEEKVCWEQWILTISLSDKSSDLENFQGIFILDLLSWIWLFSPHNKPCQHKTRSWQNDCERGCSTFCRL